MKSAKKYILVPPLNLIWKNTPEYLMQSVTWNFTIHYPTHNNNNNITPIPSTKGSPNWPKSHKFVFVSCLFWWHFFVETWPLVLTSLSGLEHYFYVSNCSLHKPQIHNYYYYSFIEFIFLEKHCQEIDKIVKC